MEHPSPDGFSRVPTRTGSAPPRWVVAVVLLAAVLCAAGAVVAWRYPALLVSRDSDINQATRVYAGYLISRNLALAVALLTLLGLRCYRMLAGALVLIALIQLLDAAIDAGTGRLALVPGLTILAAALLAAATRLPPLHLRHLAGQRTP